MLVHVLANWRSLSQAVRSQKQKCIPKDRKRECTSRFDCLRWRVARGMVSGHAAQRAAMARPFVATQTRGRCRSLVAVLLLRAHWISPERGYGSVDPSSLE